MTLPAAIALAVLPSAAALVLVYRHAYRLPTSSFRLLPSAFAPVPFPSPSSTANMSKATCQTLRPWLRANLGQHCLAPLTGADAKLLDAAVHCVEAYSLMADQAAADAFGAVVRTMRPEVRELAYHAIAHAMDWSHRAELWTQAGLPAFTPRRCTHEH